MGRHVSDIDTTRGTEDVERIASGYLRSEGFEKANYRHEEVWQKGRGLAIGGQFIKVALADHRVHIEAWTTFALPGVHLFETGTKGFINAAAKRKLRPRVEELERLLS